MAKKPYYPTEKIKDKARPVKTPRQFSSPSAGKKKSGTVYGKLGSRPY